MLLSFVLLTVLFSKNVMLIEPTEFFQFIGFFILYCNIAISSLILRYILKPRSIFLFYKLSNKYVLTNFPSDESNASTTLFSETIPLFLYLLFLLPLIIGIAWYVQLFGKFGAYIFVIALTSLTIWIMRGDKSNFIFHFMYIFITILLLSVELYTMSVILVGTVCSLGIYAFYQKKIILKFKYDLGWEKLSLLLRYNNRLAKNIQKKLFSTKTSYSFQSTVIFLITLFYIIGPVFLQFMPDNIKVFQSEYDLLISDTKDYIPYIAFVFYLGLLTSNFLVFFSNPFSLKEDKLRKKIANVLITALIGMSVMPVFVLPVILLGSLLIAVGHNMLGINFTIILGFFVFPIWANKVYSYLLAVLLWAFPEKLLLRKINEKLTDNKG